MLTLKNVYFIINFLAFCHIQDAFGSPTKFQKKAACIKEIKMNFGIDTQRPPFKMYAANAIKLLRDSPDINLNTITSEHTRNYYNNVVFKHLVYDKIPPPVEYCEKFVKAGGKDECLSQIYANFGETDNVSILVDDMYKNHVLDRIPSSQRYAKDYMLEAAKHIQVSYDMVPPSEYCDEIYYGKEPSTGVGSSNSNVDVALRL